MAAPIVVESTTSDYFVLYASHDLDPTAYRTLQLRSFFGSLRVAVYRLSTTTMCVEHGSDDL